MEYRRHNDRVFQHLLSAPFIYVQIAPLLVLDFFMECYHHLCFPLYDLPLVKREKYIVFDRHKLSYLVWYEKVNCVYCSYANGLLQYCVAIAAATEKYWCGIKHSAREGYASPAHHEEFLPYGDAMALTNFENGDEAPEACGLVRR